MRKRVHRWFFAWDFEKEEKWLNEMSAKGLHLINVGFCTYVFEEGEPGEYAVRVQMLNHLPANAKEEDYIRFVSESGAEYIGSVFRWVYFRKKTNDGEFQLFSDIDSRLRQINALMFLFGLLLFAEGMIFFPRLMDYRNQTFRLPTMIALGLVVFMLGYASLKTFGVRRRLLKERVLRE